MFEHSLDFVSSPVLLRFRQLKPLEVLVTLGFEELEDAVQAVRDMDWGFRPAKPLECRETSKASDKPHVRSHDDGLQEPEVFNACRKAGEIANVFSDTFTDDDGRDRYGCDTLFVSHGVPSPTQGVLKASRAGSGIHSPTPARVSFSPRERSKLSSPLRQVKSLLPTHSSQHGRLLCQNR